ncbi:MULTISPECIES: STAS domain-containing protein [unclassified Streptomyces]|uniref:STAS domain-containing protein n=1 Tax=unclassified Streptomyces TaxID=2593676 RepID=UPI0036FD2AC8
MPDDDPDDTSIAVEVRGLPADRTLVTVKGHLDLHTAHRLGDALEPLLLADRQVLVDLSAVTFLDSTGLTTLIHAHRTSRTTDTRLALIAPSAPVRQMLHLTGVDRVVNTYPSLDAVPHRT